MVSESYPIARGYVSAIWSLAFRNPVATERIVDSYQIAICNCVVVHGVGGERMVKIDARPGRIRQESAFGFGSHSALEFSQIASTDIYCGFAFHERAGGSV